ncbi:MAG: 4-phosphopantoate--beta-alanine ligase [Candidatus Thermoplasmatota archaeon]
MQIPRAHPRYRSLRTREMLAKMMEQGIVTPTGLIAHGRGEAFDYLLGERTPPEAVHAAKAAAHRLITARHPVISVNGNTAALAGREVIALARQIPARIEVNLFHRTEARIALVCEYLESLGAEGVLGRNAEKRIPGLSQPRARCARDGIYAADAVLVPLEDGDRAIALREMGKCVIAIDLNPLSRTAMAAHITIVDELTRALPLLTGHVKEARKDPSRYKRRAAGFDNAKNLMTVRRRMVSLLEGIKAPQ